jgi:asparagine synthase (glutamine-hydrolysing)
VSHSEDLLLALRTAVKEDCDEAQVGILFSGGLDSTILAMLAAEMTRVRLYTIGVPGAHDLSVSEVTARSMGLDWVPIELDRERILSSLPAMSSILGTENSLVLSFEMPLFIVAQRSDERLLISGQGADELFGGYARYARMGEEELRNSLDADMEGLLTVGSAREKALARHFGKEIRHPYLHHAVLQAAKGIPVTELVRDGERKRVLRAVATILGLEDAASRPKKAAQYGSGVMREMKAEARRRKVPLGQLVPSLRESETL